MILYFENNLLSPILIDKDIVIVRKAMINLFTGKLKFITNNFKATAIG